MMEIESFPKCFFTFLHRNEAENCYEYGVFEIESEKDKPPVFRMISPFLARLCFMGRSGDINIKLQTVNPKNGHCPEPGMNNFTIKFGLAYKKHVVLYGEKRYTFSKFMSIFFSNRDNITPKHYTLYETTYEEI